MPSSASCSPAATKKVTTADLLRAIGQTRRTLTTEIVAEFEQDIQDYARV